MHGLVEVDVTEARRRIREIAAGTGERISFTAFLIGCLARAVSEDPEVQAFRRGYRRLVIFDDVDVAVLLEVDADGVRVPLFHVVRDAGRRSTREIHEEIRRAQASRADLEARRRQIRRARWVPRPLRSVLWRLLTRAPRTWKRYGGTVVVTAVGMFGTGPGFALPAPGGYPLSLTVGGIGVRPLVVDGRVESHEHLCLTVTFDHSVVDGAPAARFTARLKELIEGAHGLDAPGLTP